jgi:hypothetical protein
MVSGALPSLGAVPMPNIYLSHSAYFMIFQGKNCLFRSLKRVMERMKHKVETCKTFDFDFSIIWQQKHSKIIKTCKKAFL